VPLHEAPSSLPEHDEVWSSSIPRRKSGFTKRLDEREDVKLFFKLPPWFRVQTPMGEYNPDWAIVKEEDDVGRLYLIRETKGSGDSEQLRGRELKKVECGKAHFAALGVDYKVVTSHNEI